MTIDPRLQGDDSAGGPARPNGELEQQVVAAIREHRQLFESDQAVYEEWERASKDPQATPAVVQSLQEEYLRRRQTTAAQQEVLAGLIDALGYVPHVPSDGDDDQNSTSP